MQEIDWDDWNSRIITDGLVDKVRTNFQEQSTQEYNLDGLFTQIFSKESNDLDLIVSLPLCRTMKWPSIQLCGSIITDSMSNILMTSTPSPNLKIIASLNGAICIQDCKLLLPLSQKLIPTSKVPEMISICLPT